MSASRLELQTQLEVLLGSRNVYYNPPASKQMQYDAIRYSLSNINSRFANNIRYKNMDCYELVVISRKADPEVVTKILNLPYTSLGRPYVAENLYHYPISIYY